MSHLGITGMQADAVAAPSHGKSTPADDKGAAATPVEADEHFQQVQIRSLLIATSQGGYALYWPMRWRCVCPPMQVVIARLGLLD